MSTLLFNCPKTHQQAPTGIETDVKSFKRRMEGDAESELPPLWRSSRYLGARSVHQWRPRRYHQAVTRVSVASAMPIDSFLKGERHDPETKRVLGVAFEMTCHSAAGRMLRRFLSNKPSPIRSSILPKLLSVTPTCCANRSCLPGCGAGASRAPEAHSAMPDVARGRASLPVNQRLRIQSRGPLGTPGGPLYQREPRPRGMERLHRAPPGPRVA